MGLLRYLRKVLYVAASHSFHWTHTLVLIALIAYGSAETFIHSFHLPHIPEWQFMAAILLSILVVRLVLAPYWIYTAQEKQISKLRAEIAGMQPQMPQILTEQRLEFATEANSHIIPLGNNSFSVMFARPLRFTPSISFQEPRPTEANGFPRLEYWSALGFTVTFPQSYGDVRQIRFEANARS